ncbi:SagB family peptide dehydrogenase [Nonomuraea sediminis]|uniref:SagB family peptide dehydrogenase n=1 Tax=Nonomuraea sediminis TaxID=2835864 RepID=UPI001BDBBE0D|nr:SagB family peptide dehydrogenase [Nonomuraea sediminis]
MTLYHLRAGVHLARLDSGARLFAWPHAETLGELDEEEYGLLRELASGPRNASGPLVDRLLAGGWLKITITGDGGPLYTLDPLKAPPARPGISGRWVLSKFAAVRREAGGVVVRSPLAWCDLWIHDHSLLADVVEPGGRLLGDLVWAGLAVPEGSEEGELRSAQWSPQELEFHDRSRVGFRGYLGDGFGGTFWARGRFEPEPARPEPYPGTVVELPRPDLAELKDPALTDVLEGRRSRREHDDERPVGLAQLGELLYRAARVREQWTADDVEYTSKPYPSGGSVYELELYPVIRHAAGIAPGMYHYDAHNHVLRLVREAGHPAVRRLLTVAGHGAATGRRPQVLLAVSARAGRILWKYEGMGYALMLKHVGVLYQTLYLVATAMGLAACGLGGGDSVAFAEATGRDPLRECAVGEFMIGSVEP